MIFGKAADPLALIQQGKFKEAARLLEVKLKKSPHDFSMKMRLAEAYEGEGRKDDAGAIYISEAEANLSGGDRNQGLALLKKASRLLPSDAALGARIAKLEGQPEPSGDQSFSFDIDMSDSGEESASIASGGDDQVMAEAPVVAVRPEPPAVVAGPSPIQAPPEPAFSGEIEETGFAMTEFAAEAPEPPAAIEADPEVVIAPDEPSQPQGAEALETLPAEAHPSIAAPPERPAPVPQTPAPPIAGDDLGDMLSAIVPEMSLPLVESYKEDDVDAVVMTFISCLFPELDGEHIDLLRSAGQRCSISAGETLLREEEPGDSLFIVVEGHLEAKGRFEGHVISLATFGPGDVIGEVAFLKRVPRTATVTAIDDSLLLELPAERTREQFCEFPDMQVQLDSILGQRVERTLQLVKQIDKDPHGYP